MNAERRSKIEKIKEELDVTKAAIEELQQEEQDYYDNMPESLQGGEKGERASEAADQLQQAADSLDEAINNLDSAIE